MTVILTEIVAVILTEIVTVILTEILIQQRVRWNVFLVRRGRVPCQNGSCLIDPHF